MTLSMYQASVPVFLSMLENLSNILTRAQANASERKIDPSVFLTARLAPDMFALTRQVQIATDHAKGAPSRLAGREVPKYDDTETTFEELQARIEKTRNHLKTFAPADIDGSEERVIEIKGGGRQFSFSGAQYLLRYALPNFYFHTTTAYDILRHNGVDLHKRDFIGGS
jgi:hypothetical protein